MTNKKKLIVQSKKMEPLLGEIDRASASSREVYSDSKEINVREGSKYNPPGVKKAQFPSVPEPPWLNDVSRRPVNSFVLELENEDSLAKFLRQSKDDSGGVRLLASHRDAATGKIHALLLRSDQISGPY